MEQNIVLIKGISPLTTANDVLKKLRCKDKVERIEMLFDCFPKEGRWYGDAYLEFPDPSDAQAVLANPTYKIRGVKVDVEGVSNRSFSSSEITNYSECMLSVSNFSFESSITETSNDESSSSDSKQADENFNSVLIKNLSVHKGNAFGVKNYLSQFGEIESLSVHYERDSKESYAICRFVEAQSKLNAIKYKTPFVCYGRVEITKIPRNSLIYPSLLPSCKDLDRVYRQIRKLDEKYDQRQKKGEGSANSGSRRNVDDVNQRPRSSACTWTRVTEASFGKDCELSVDLSSVAAKSITFKSSYEPCEGKEGLFVNVVV